MDKIEELTGILERLNSGEDPAKVKAEAKQLLSTIDPADLSIAEQHLVEKGLAPEDLRKLCTLHLELLEDQSAKLKEKLPREHVIATLINEHETILCFLDDLDFVNQSIQKMPGYKPEREEFRRLLHIAEQLIGTELHHQREEDILFPELEKRGVYGPPMVMKGEHAELRQYKHKLLELAKTVSQMEFGDFRKQLDGVVRFIVPMLREHIFKENNILYPTALEVIDNTEVWLRLKADCDRIGYCCFKPSG
ncbi:MAG: DUF438 domain-containing protein [Planctomycetota bacterium]